MSNQYKPIADDNHFTEAITLLPLNLHMQQLAYLQAVERWETLTEAASHLQVSQPALSQSLSQLEQRLGTALLERAGRRRRLTEAGLEVSRFAGEVLGLAAELRDWLREREAGRAGTLRVGMIDAASLYVLPETVRSFRTSYPNVHLTLIVDRSAMLLDQLKRFELDIAFVIGPTPAGYRSNEILREPLYIYSPPGALEEPEEADWVLYPRGRQTRLLIDEGLALRGLWPRVTLESDNPAVLRQMVALGLGWSVLPPAIAEAGEQSLHSQRHELIAERTLLAVRREHALDDTRINEFLRLVEEREASPNS
jgi:DNA-binding transcriptional LysR family regulator